MLVLKWRKRDTYTPLVRMQANGANREDPQKTKNTTYDAGILFLGIHAKESKHDMEIPAHPLYSTAKIGHQPRCPSTDEQIRCGVYIY